MSSLNYITTDKQRAVTAFYVKMSQKLKFELLSHSLCISDLTTCDYYIYRVL
jgi:hypothetical protein